MFVYEFYLKDATKGKDFEALCEGFYAIGEKFTRKVDNGNGSAVYSVTRNQSTNWVQLLVDDNTPASFITMIEAKIREYSDLNDKVNKTEGKHYNKRTFAYHNVAPMERERAVIGI